MGLSDSAYAAASHVLLLLIAVTLIFRLVRFLDGRVVKLAIDRYDLIPALALCCIGLAIERAYYVAARMLVTSGLNLWQLHPAPEVLSAIMAASMYAVHVSLTRAHVDHDSRSLQFFRQRIGLELVGAVMIWSLVAWWLY
ncbi:hypothetical protein [uncultured Tateyamaria sp.]|uniref:hypothetical protein n=1 Tax=uncultured Tateyamaria sp. TaxID=455651 RepID=UPI002621C5B3|nr:hypothetical protein [uncultured Tateyamaria sp.]